ncbi:MAG: CocE/NonD family hydrolase, partial [Chloroflexota bacterium]
MFPTYEVEMRLDVKVPMRDGVNLSADIYLPRVDGPFPTILIRTPYSNNSDNLIQKARAAANIGYACVIQDTRGRWDSDGDFYALQGEGEDSFDTQEWVGQQPWCNGKIGTTGGSYLGWVQLHGAPLQSQYLTCMSPQIICNSFYHGLARGGAFQINVGMTWGM